MGLGVVGLAAAGLVASRALGSRPDGTDVGSPLAPCPQSVNCFRASVSFGTEPLAVRNAAIAAVRDHEHWFTGRALRVSPTEDGVTAVFKTGPFRDDVAVAVVPDGRGSVLHVRSASRVGESDLGVNRLRARQVLADVERRVGPRT